MSLLTAGILACALFGFGSSAGALPPDAARVVQIRPRLGSLPEELDGLMVRLRQTPHPQISVYNLTAKPLVILDYTGHGYLRIGPQNVAANLASPWFYRARFAVRLNIPDDIGGPPRWRQIGNGPSYAWWDPRLRIDKHFDLPAGISRGPARFIRRWRIPVRLGEVTSAISGYFVYHPAPDGVYRVQVTSKDNLGAGVAVLPLVGKTPGVFIHNRSDRAFTVKGIHGEPFLRFLKGKVLVNPTSKTWRRAAPEDTLVPYDDTGAQRWVVISTTDSFGWRDPRVAADGEIPENHQPAPVHEWQIPVMVDGDERVIEGRTWWLPQVTADFGKGA